MSDGPQEKWLWCINRIYDQPLLRQEFIAWKPQNNNGRFAAGDEVRWTDRASEAHWFGDAEDASSFLNEAREPIAALVDPAATEPHVEAVSPRSLLCHSPVFWAEGTRISGDAPARTGLGMVYAAVTEDRFVKFGFSQNPEKRLAELQTGNPRPLFLFDSFDASRAVEQRLHQSLDHYHVNGEWFRFEPAVISTFWGARACCAVVYGTAFRGGR